MTKNLLQKIFLLGLLALASFFFHPGSTSAAESLAFEDMYAGASARGLVLSDKLRQLEGQEVTIEGFMAPPLKPSIEFFVLTAVPMSICPFCSTDADWPDNIIVIKLPEPVTALPFDSPIQVQGRLEIGSEVDPATGFVSQLRIAANEVNAL